MCLGLVASTIEVQKVDAGGNKPIELVYGPDIHGVVCYRDARNSYGDPLSCVKAY
ncbi:hypothetical protein HWB52_gp38 [Pseudomonas phage Littlefix]|uniref:Uncharacterized protein n=1 Tax=Pseudomonas phage Littlefix TaxID=2079289 RepID=A0A2K9VHM7_9CAUD|nr:hypothetical protein HWB52_gp38 [Pseudomonas phage Littlefix]AUV61853.1 hypothetical protein PsPhLittlefix_gp38 [Pseudomonas phage Littlefix]